MGSATVQAYCKGQGVIALSSGEAEFYGLVSATKATLGLRSMLKDWGWNFGGTVLMDANAGISIGSRRGLGQVKHIDTQFLWIQEVYNKKEMTLGKRSTHEMLANFLTKPSDENDIVKCTKGLNMHYESGKHKMSLKSAIEE